MRTILVCCLSIAGPVFALEIPGEQAPGALDPVAYALEMNERYDSLARDGGLVPATKRLYAAPTAEELGKIGTTDCLTCGPNGSGRLQVGLVMPANGTYVLGDLVGKDLAGGKNASLDGGIARIDEKGRLIATIAVEVQRAGGVRIELDDMALADGMELYLYSDHAEAHGPYTGAGVMGDGHMWTNAVAGPAAYLELRSAGLVTDDMLRKTRFRIVGLGYLDSRYFLAPDDKTTYCGLDSCFQDRTCVTSADWAHIEDTSNAVGHMVFAVGSNFFVCSGGLLADTDSTTVKNYFLSANHCFNTQQSAASLECYFQFKTLTCGGTCPQRTSAPSTLGSTLKASSATSDFLFLELAQNPPAGSFYLGWTTTPITTAGVPLFRVSHPDGNAQGYTTSTSDTTFTACLNVARPAFLYSRTTLGATKGGSSGSPVLNANGLVVGQLFGVCPNASGNPNNVCDTVNLRNIDGAFATTFPAIQTFLTPPAGNNDFANAATITGASGTQAANNTNATKETGEPNHGGNAGGHSLWYKWTSPKGQWAKFNTTGSAITAPLGIYTGTAVNSLTTIVGSAVGTPAAFLADPSIQYKVGVDGLSGTTGAITLNWIADVPPNNNFASSTLLSGATGTMTGSNVAATSEASEPTHAGTGGSATVWYRWVATKTGNFEFETSGSNFDTVLAVYTGTALTNLVQVAANDNRSGGDSTSRLVFQTTNATTYRIAVAGNSTATGFAKLNWKEASAAPANDNFASAQTLSGNSGSVSGNNNNATRQASEPVIAGTLGGASVWYQWTPTVSGPATIDTFGSGFDTLLAVYTGTAFANLAAVGTNDNDPGQSDGTSKVAFTAASGTPYRIAVDGVQGVNGSLTLNYSAAPPTPPTLAISNPSAVDCNAQPPASVDVDVSLLAANNPGTFGFDLPFAVTSGNGTISFTGANAHGTILTWSQIKVEEVSSGLLRLTATKGGGSDLTGDQSILTLHFRFDAPTPQAMSANLQPTALTGGIASFQIDGGLIGCTIASGDSNSDSRITPNDAQLAFDCFLLGACPGGTNATKADFCGGGSVTPSDAEGIFNVFLGLADPCSP